MSHESASDMEIAFSRGVLRFRWAVMALALGVVSVLALGATKLSITNSYRVFFNPDNPDLLAFDSAQRMFSHNDNVMFVVVPANDNVFTRSNLQAIKTVTERAWHLPYASRVDSVTNFQHTEASGDELTVRDLVGKPEALSPDELQKIRSAALSEPVLAGNLVAVDGRAAAVNAFVLLPGKDEHHEIPEVVSAARKLAAQVEHEFPEVKVRLTGVLMMDNAFAEASLHDAQTLVALSFTLMLVMTAVLMGGPVAGIGTALVVGLAIAAAMGVAGYLGYQVSPPMAAAPVIILTVAIANCVHILQSFLERWSAGGEREEAIVYAVSTNLTPIFLASLTTVIGFLTFNFSDVPPFRQLGNIVAFGDIASYLLAVTLLPAVLAVAPLRRPSPRPLRVNAFKRLCEFVLARRRALLVGMALVIVALLATIPRNRLNDVFLHYFDETIAFRADSDYTIAHLTGLYHVQFTLRASEAGGVSEPAFLRDVQSFTGWLRSQPEVVHVNSFVDTMKRLNRNMHGDDTEYYRLPESRELAAQYLLLYEMSLPYGLDLNNQINVDKSALRINLALRTLSSSQFIDFKKRAERWAQRHTPAIVSADGSGTIMMFSQIGQKNIRSMLTGTVVALVLISFVLLLMLRSVKLGLISLAPNLLPPALGFGLWGIISGEITLSLSVVTSMTLGIIIDDTVHFLVRYQRARKAGANPEMAVRETYSEVAPAMFFTSIILITGFLVLALSHFELNAGMGLLTAIVIGFALVLDLLLLSPLLLLIEEKSDASAAAAPDHAAAS